MTDENKTFIWSLHIKILLMLVNASRTINSRAVQKWFRSPERGQTHELSLNFGDSVNAYIVYDEGNDLLNIIKFNVYFCIYAHIMTWLVLQIS